MMRCICGKRIPNGRASCSDKCYHNIRYQKNKKDLIKRAIEWNKDHPKRVKEIGHNQYLKNKKKIKTNAKIWQKKNPDKVKKSDHKYYMKNRSKYVDNSMRWKQKNPKKAKAIQKKSNEKSYLKRKSLLNS